MLHCVAGTHADRFVGTPAVGADHEADASAPTAATDQPKAAKKSKKKKVQVAPLCCEYDNVRTLLAGGMNTNACDACWLSRTLYAGLILVKSPLLTGQEGVRGPAGGGCAAGGWCCTLAPGLLTAPGAPRHRHPRHPARCSAVLMPKSQKLACTLASLPFQTSSDGSASWQVNADGVLDMQAV